MKTLIVSKRGVPAAGALIMFLALAVVGPAPASAHGNAFAFAIGGEGLDESRAVATDAEGNTYVAGQYGSASDFDPGPGVDVRTPRRKYPIGDSFVASYTAAGELRWAATNPGTGYAAGVAVSGDFVFYAGTFFGRQDFDPGPGLLRMESAGYRDAYVIKLRRDDGSLVWAKTFGGRQYDFVWTMVVGGGRVYVGGEFLGRADFDPGPNRTVLRPSNAGNGFVLALSSDSGAFKWVRQTGGSGAALMLDLAVNDAGDVLAVGEFYGTDVTFGPDGQPMSSENGEGFVTKLTRDGKFDWVRRIPANLQSVAAGADDRIAVAGEFAGSVDFDPGAGTSRRTAKGGSDVFVASYDSTGDFQFVRTAGSVGSERDASVAFDTTGRVVVAGAFSKTVDFEPGPSQTKLTSAGLTDVFVWILSPSGEFAAAHRIGGRGRQQARAVATVGTDVVVAGLLFGRADFDPGEGRHVVESNGYNDAFVVRLTEA